MENKGYGGAPAVAISRGECHWRKMQAALASKLTARASGCSLLARWFKRPGGPETQSPFILSFWGCETQGAVRGRQWDTVGCLDWTILQFWDRTSCLPWLCRFALTGCNMAWTKSKWDNDDSIFFLSLFCFLFSYQCLNEQNNKNNNNNKSERKSPSVSGTVTFLFFQVFRLFVFPWFIGMMLFYSFKERHKISIQREKNSNNAD